MTAQQKRNDILNVKAFSLVTKAILQQHLNAIGKIEECKTMETLADAEKLGSECADLCRKAVDELIETFVNDPEMARAMITNAVNKLFQRTLARLETTVVVLAVQHGPSAVKFMFERAMVECDKAINGEMTSKEFETSLTA